jgi:hypothetical protein
MELMPSERIDHLHALDSDYFERDTHQGPVNREVSRMTPVTALRYPCRWRPRTAPMTMSRPSNRLVSRLARNSEVGRCATSPRHQVLNEFRLMLGLTSGSILFNGARRVG